MRVTPTLKTSIGPAYFVELSGLEELSTIPDPHVENMNSERIWRGGKGGGKGDEGDGNQFCGGISRLSKLNAFYRSGWEEGVTKMLNALAEIKGIPGAIAMRRRPSWEEQGDELSQDRLWSGQLDSAWRTTRRRRSPGTTHNRILLDLGGRAIRQPGDWFWRGAAAAWVCDSAEAAGRRVEVLGYSTGKNTHKGTYNGTIVTVPLKGAHEPLDLPRLVAGACHAATLRTGIFATRIACAGDKAVTGAGKSFHGLHPGGWQEGDLLLSDVWNLDSAVGWINKVREELGA